VVDAAAERSERLSVAAGSFREQKEAMAAVERGKHEHERVVGAVDGGAVDEDGVKDAKGEEAAKSVAGPVVSGGDRMGEAGKGSAEDSEVKVAGVVREKDVRTGGGGRGVAADAGEGENACPEADAVCNHVVGYPSQPNANRIAWRTKAAS